MMMKYANQSVTSPSDISSLPSLLSPEKSWATLDKQQVYCFALNEGAQQSNGLNTGCRGAWCSSALTCTCRRKPKNWVSSSSSRWASSPRVYPAKTSACLASVQMCLRLDVMELQRPDETVHLHTTLTRQESWLTIALGWQRQDC